MNRRESRESAFKMAFPLSLYENSTSDEYIESLKETDEIKLDEFSEKLFRETNDNLSVIDSLIEKSLKDWQISRIPKVSLAVLRISVAQLCYMKEIGESVVINEAVELTKKYGGDDDYSFVNGSLRTINEIVKNDEA